MPMPTPTPIYRMIHMNNLSVVLQRSGLHAPKHTPNDGLVYQGIHNQEVQSKRRQVAIPCGPGGCVHDYVPFYLGPRSPMLLQLKSGSVADYNEGQEPIIYLLSTIQQVAQSGQKFVFSDGHGLASFTTWYADLAQLCEVDWDIVYASYWFDDANHMDRQRRKQAEFLIHRFCPWELITKIGVFNVASKTQVERIMAQFNNSMRRLVEVRPEWYY